jgi:hypothetical protein
MARSRAALVMLSEDAFVGRASGGRIVSAYFPMVSAHSGGSFGVGPGPVADASWAG